MKIFILDKFKITKFELPEKVEDSFLIPYKGYNNKNDIFVTVESNNDKWQLKSNGSVNILDGANIMDNIVLENYNYYTLKILGQEDYVTLFSLPSKDEEIYKLDTKGLTNITIGSSQNANISYRNNLTAELHAEIKFINNEWYIAASADDTYRTYINGERILTAKLNVGDVIFINGLKIIWMKSFIKINNPRQDVRVSGIGAFDELDVVDNTKYIPATDEESNVELYKEDDYFYHMPRLVPTIDPIDVEIDSPPVEEKMEDLPLLLSLGTSVSMAASSLMMGFSIYSSISTGQKTWLSALPQIITTVCMIFASLVMPRIMKKYQKKQKIKKEALRQKKYSEYLEKINTKIQYALKQQTQIMKENNYSGKECFEIIRKRNRNFWCRVMTDEDFLKIRLGVGDIKSFVTVKAPQEKFSLYTDNLQEKVFEVDKNSKMLNNVPITLDLADQTVLAFIFNCTYKNDYTNGIITQLVALHSALELKIVVFTNEQNAKRWEFVKFFPHCWSDDKQERYFATTQDEMKEVSACLEEILKSRILENKEGEKDSDKKTPYKGKPPYYLIFTDDYKFVKNVPIVDSIQKSNRNMGFSLITLSNSIKNLPNNCEKFVEIGEKESCILEKKLSSESQIIFKNDEDKNLDMRSVAVNLSNVPLLTKDALKSLPTSLSFLEMYGVSKIEQLNILNRWKTNNPVTTLSTPIGVQSDGEQFKLDLHEKFHGPHGLIAGSTGSGKSEFIITYILSMCVNYHPYEVQFVLIDYKGGGLAGAFENKDTGVKAPHLVGTITNLDTAEMNRTLVSISSELKRRQKKFNEVKDKLEESTMDIYKYQKLYREGLIEEPMAHLFIISDEFAELKSQQPEFLAELVSTARIGRSLGVHLILATQKPSGVVNDQIWSNSKFKICLKVQDKSDSMEMLKRPEAASIKETGRFYLQVGYDDYFDVGQSGWGGARYIPTDKIIKKVDDSINFVNNTGNVFKSINEIIKKETVEDLGDQLTNIVKYIYKIGVKENLVTRKMWLDNIPKEIFINDVKQKYDYKPVPYQISPVIGEYDNPSSQAQSLLNLDLSKNTLIYGQGGSGKENLLSTIIWSSCIEHTPDEINFYIVDCGAEILKMFYKFPHVGEFIGIDEGNKINDLLEMVSNELDRRKEEYADYAGNYVNYCESSGKKDPRIVIIINSYEVFGETFKKLPDLLTTFYRDGVKYGITFILSCIAGNAIGSRVAQNFGNKLTMQMPNKEDYRNILGAPRGLEPTKTFGRGIVALNDTAYEYQTAFITNLKEINNVVREASKKLNEAYTTKARKVPTVPEIITIDTLGDRAVTLNEFPIAYNMNDKSIYAWNFTKNRFNSIVSADMVNRISFVKAFVKLFKKINGINLKIVDFVDVLGENFEGITIYKNDFDSAVVTINNEIAVEANSNLINCYIFIGIGDYANSLSETGKNILNNLFNASSAIQKSYFIFIDDYNLYRNIQLEEWYKSYVDKANGIWLGPGLSNQTAFEVSNISMDIRNLDFPEMAFAINKSKFTIIKHVTELEDEDEE